MKIEKVFYTSYFNIIGKQHFDGTILNWCQLRTHESSSITSINCRQVCFVACIENCSFYFHLFGRRKFDAAILKKVPVSDSWIFLENKNELALSMFLCKYWKFEDSVTKNQQPEVQLKLSLLTCRGRIQFPRGSSFNAKCRLIVAREKVYGPLNESFCRDPWL